MRKQPKVDPKKRKGLIIVHTGDGKGKSTAAFGLAMRAAGNKMNVFIMQFMKGPWKAGERKAFDSLSPYVEIVPMGDGFTWRSKDLDQSADLARALWEDAKEIIAKGDNDLIILDEFTYPLHYGWIEVQEVIETLSNRPEMLHIIITGRHAPQGLIDFADLVTEMNVVKHPYSEGIKAQPGIEF